MGKKRIPKPKNFTPVQFFPPDHKVWPNKQRCTAWNSNHGRQCEDIAMKRKTKCRRDGGASLSGLQSPKLTTGRWSKYIPLSLAQTYEDNLGDPNFLSTKEDIAILRALAADALSQSRVGENSDANPAWKDARQAYLDLQKAMKTGGDEGAKKLVEAMDKLGEIIQPQYRAAAAERKTVDLLLKQSKVVDNERRAMIDMQKYVQLDRMLFLIGQLMFGVREAVIRHTDKPTQQLILGEAQKAYDSITTGD